MLERRKACPRSFFLTSVPAPIPPGLVAALYASVYPHTTWRFLGCVSNEQVRARWPATPSYARQRRLVARR